MAKVNSRVLAGAVIGAAAVAAAFAMVKSNDVTIGHMGKVERGKEKCFGVVTAGENACASPGGGHTCGGLATLDYSGQEWTLVASGSCMQMGGKLQAFEGVSQPPAKPDAQG